MANHPLFPKNGPGPTPGMSHPQMGTALHQMASALVMPGGGQAVATQNPPTTPVPGPNAFEVAVASYDPDAQIVVVRVKTAADAEEIEAVVDLGAATNSGVIEMVLGDSKLSPKIQIKILPKVTPPKFATIEEAEAWMEANS